MEASSTAVQARAVKTVDWLCSPNMTFAVPVYQRHYRWAIDDCRHLLDDIRRVADDGHRVHFLGSILATTNTPDGVSELVLVDGQQRIVTLTLLFEALRGSIEKTQPAVAQQLQRALLDPTNPKRTRLRLHKKRMGVFERLIVDKMQPQEDSEKSWFDDNLEFFLGEVARDPDTIWRGLQRLEHIAITLGPDTDPQQVFESVNSTGAPLRDHELIHNHILIGLTHDQQTIIEDDYWVPAELDTGEAIDDFWRDLLILHRGRALDLTGDHAVYRVFRSTFPRFDFSTLSQQAGEWRRLAASYGALLNPGREADQEIRRHLEHVSTFGRAMYPVLMAIYRRYTDGIIHRTELIGIMEQMQTLYLRKVVVGESRDHLAAQLCRRLFDSNDFIRVIARKCPSDERIRNSLVHRPLPHAGYVLWRLNGPLGGEELQQKIGVEVEIEHILPVFPGPSWVGAPGAEPWSLMDEERRSRHRELMQTLGNLTLLEQPLNAGASNKSYPDKLAYYAQSRLAMVGELAGVDMWDASAIEARTRRLTEQFLQIWSVPSSEELDNAIGLTPILDLPRRPGFYPGWQSEYEYVRFGDELWEVRNVSLLYDRIFERLWLTHRQAVLEWNDEVQGPIYSRQEWTGRWAPLDERYFLFRGQFPQYKLAEIQSVLETLNLAEELTVRLSTGDEG